MSVDPPTNLLLFNVKPIWKIVIPSELTAGKVTLPEGISGKTYTIFGVDRTSMNISRNFTRIHSVEQYNQGFIVTPGDYTVSIAIKEAGEAFDAVRACGKSGIMFDIECDILRDKNIIDNVDYDLNYEPWLVGFERYIGCVINGEGQSIDVGAFPVREFDILFLRHEIKGLDQKPARREGSGTFPPLQL